MCVVPQRHNELLLFSSWEVCIEKNSALGLGYRSSTKYFPLQTDLAQGIALLLFFLKPEQMLA